MVKKRRSLFDFINGLLLALFTLAVALPILYVVSASLTPYVEMVRSGGIVLFPRAPTLEGYRTFLEQPLAIRAFLNTVFITVVGTGLSLLITTLMAYPISRRDLPGRKGFTLLAFIPMVVSAGLVPGYLVVRGMGLLNSVWAMIIPGLVSSYNLMIMKSFFTGLDKEYLEAARIDGAGETRTLVSIVLPLSLPVLCTMALFYGVAYWNTYYAAVYYVPDPTKQPLQVLLRGIISSAESIMFEATVDVAVPGFTLKMAAVVMTALPILVVYPFLQKYFVQGATLGGVKG